MATPEDRESADSSSGESGQQATGAHSRTTGAGSEPDRQWETAGRLREFLRSDGVPFAESRDGEVLERGLRFAGPNGELFMVTPQGRVLVFGAETELAKTIRHLFGVGHPLGSPDERGSDSHLEVDHAPSEAHRRGRWWLPLAIVLVSPLITTPITAAIFEANAAVDPAAIGMPDQHPASGLFGGVDTWGYARIAPTYVAFVIPGVVNLAPILWLRSSSRATRMAALLGTIWGVLRLLIPVVILTVSVRGDYVIPTTNFLSGGAQHPGCYGKVIGNDGETYLWYEDDGFCPWVPGAVAWVGTLTTLGVFSAVHRHGRARGAAEHVRLSGTERARRIGLVLALIGSGVGMLWGLLLLFAMGLASALTGTDNDAETLVLLGGVGSAALALGSAIVAFRPRHRVSMTALFCIAAVLHLVALAWSMDVEAGVPGVVFFLPAATLMLVGLRRSQPSPNVNH